MLLKVKVFWEDFVAVITLKLWTFSFELLCWVKMIKSILMELSTPYTCTFNYKFFYELIKSFKLRFSCLITCSAIWTFFIIPLSFGNDDLLKVTQFCQAVCDTADLCLSALLSRAVDRRSGEWLTFHTLTGYLNETISECTILHSSTEHGQQTLGFTY